MTTPIEILNHRLTLAIAVITIGGIGLGVMDSRHAAASDVSNLSESVQAIADSIRNGQIDELEFKISESERRAARITRQPIDERTNWDIQDLEDANIQKERYIRKLERLQE